MKKIICLLLLALTATTYAGGVKVLFIGDSITDGGWGNSGGSAKSSKNRNHWDMNHIYGHSYMFLCATYYQAKYPERKYQFFNRGISGNTLIDLEKRWEEDAIGLNPDVVSILIGTNDVTTSLSDDEFDIQKWEATYRSLLDRLIGNNPNIKFVLCTPFAAPTGRLKNSENYSIRAERLQQCTQAVCTIASDYNAHIVRFDTLFDKLLNNQSAEEGAYWIWDGIHPTPAGHKRMADLWIKKTKSLF